MTEVLDISRDDSGEITQFLILDDNGQPKTKVGSSENLLLYDPDDELPFEGGMHEFLSGDTALQLSDDILVSTTSNDNCYVLSVDGQIVQTTPNQTEEFLRGVYELLVNDREHRLVGLHQSIMDEQVRRSLVGALVDTFDDSDRIDVTTDGWLVDGFYLVDWKANLYTAKDDDESDYVRSGGSIVEEDKSYEFVRLRGGPSGDEDLSVTIDGESYTLSEREMLFLGKVKWLLNRRHYHPNESFWKYADRWAEVSVETGKPETEERPNMDEFDI
jgi:hypothetical protein